MSSRIAEMADYAALRSDAVLIYDHHRVMVQELGRIGANPFAVAATAKADGGIRRLNFHNRGRKA
jgi:hypothetical protein